MTRLWNDADWLRLTPWARLVLLLYMTHPTSRKGICPLQPELMAALVGLPRGWDPDDEPSLEGAMEELHALGVFVDFQVAKPAHWAGLLAPEAPCPAAV